MNRLEKAEHLHKELEELTTIDGLCIAIMYHVDPTTVYVWLTEDNNTFDEATPIVLEQFNGVFSITYGGKYVPSIQLDIKERVVAWLSEELS